MEITVALSGNPNAGKTTIFNQLTGARQKVGNWPGVTVEKKEGVVNYKGHILKIVDLPGIYSLTAYSIEEIIARDFILKEQPEVVVNVIDASNLERNLYLAIQLMELGRPLIFVMNMIDVAKSKGIFIDFDLLSKLFGVPIVKTVGTKGIGIDDLLETIIAVAEGHIKSRPVSINYGPELEREIHSLIELIIQNKSLVDKYPPRWLAIKLLENDREIIRIVKKTPQASHILNYLDKSIRRLKEILDETPEAIIAEARYGFISGALREVMKVSTITRRTLSDRIDDVVTNKFFGFPIFILAMYALFYFTFNLGEYPVAAIEKGLDILSNFLSAKLPDSLLKDLLIDGVIGGVGGVLVFLPNILLLFLGISIFEDTGYLARAAFIMDRIMHFLGLHGKSFIPLLMGFGCNVPAIMATRTLENPKDRILTILINPLMSCSARLPVYVLFASTFFPGKETRVIFSIYALGIFLAMLLGKIFSRFLIKDEDTPFVLELPPYRMPTIKGLIIHMWEKTKVYLQKMGGVILIFSIILWALSAFPRINGSSPPIDKSYIGHIGKVITPILKPLGFNWQMGVSLVTGVVAKEVVVSSLGVLYHIEERETHSLQEALLNSGIYKAAALGFMAFVLIYIPCIATVAVIWKETGSIRWPIICITYELCLAWIVAFIIYHLGLWLEHAG